MTPSWMTPVSEPRNGRYVLVGTNPEDVVAVRADRAGTSVGEWYRLTGCGSAPVSWEELTTPPAPSSDPLRPTMPLPVTPLYLAAQAIEDLVNDVVAAAYQRNLIAAQTAAASGATGAAAQYQQAAMALRALGNDLAARHGAPAPRWEPGAPTVPGADERTTQVIEMVPADTTAQIPAVAAAQEEPRQWSWRDFVPAWFAGQGQPGGRHRRAGWAALNVQARSGGGGAKVGASG